MKDISITIDRYASFDDDVVEGMSEYQIVHFVLGQIPPVGRYHQCCLEIKRRRQALKTISANIERTEGLKKEELQLQAETVIREMEVFGKMAEKWKPLVEGKNFDDDEVQRLYWDQHFGFRLCLAILRGGLSDDLVQNIMSLHDGSSTKRFLTDVINKCDKEAISLIDTLIEEFVEEFTSVDDIKQPKLPDRRSLQLP